MGLGPGGRTIAGPHAQYKGAKGVNHRRHLRPQEHQPRAGRRPWPLSLRELGWTKDDAREALAARILERDAPKLPMAPLTFDQAAARSHSESPEAFAARLAAINPRTKRAYSAAAVNRPLDAVATGPGLSTKSAQDAKIDAERHVSP